MKHHFGSFLAGAVTFALAASLTFSAIAISGRMTIEVDPVNVQVNGEVFVPTDANGNAVPVFAYNGTTYAPLRALAEAYGLDVGYDAASNMATVAAPETKDAPSTQAPNNAVSDDWTAEDEAIYQTLIEDWEFKLLGKVSTIGVGDADRANYLATPKTDSAANFDWNSFEKSDSFRKIATKIVNTVNTTNLQNTTINYSGGRWISTYDGEVSIWSA